MRLRKKTQFFTNTLKKTMGVKDRRWNDSCNRTMFTEEVTEGQTKNLKLSF